MRNKLLQDAAIVLLDYATGIYALDSVSYLPVNEYLKKLTIEESNAAREGEVGCLIGNGPDGEDVVICRFFNEALAKEVVDGQA